MIISVLCFIYLWSIYLKGLLGSMKDILCKMLSIELRSQLAVILYLLGRLAVSRDSFGYLTLAEEGKCN